MSSEEVVLERLELTPMFDLIRRIRSNSESGTLVLRNGDVIRRVLFNRGEIVLSQSNQVGERLGEFLVEQDVLSRPEMEEYLGRLDGREPFGALLVRFGVVSRTTLGAFLRSLVIRILSSCVGWKEGTAAFERGIFPVAPELFLNVSTAGILLEVVRHCESVGVLNRTLELCGRRLEWVPHAREAVPLSLAPAEYFVVSRFEGKPIDLSTAEQVIPDKRLLGRTLVGLVLAGWLAPPSAGDAVVEPGLADGSDEATRALVELVEKMDGLTYYEFLGIPAGASQSEIKSKQEELKAFYNREHGTAEYRFHRRKVLIKLDEAFAILGDPDRRKGYDRMIVGTRKAQATHEFVERRELQKSIAKTNFERANELIEEEDTFGAIQLLEQAIIFDPDNCDYLWLLAVSKLKNPKWTKEAADVFQKIVTLDPSRSEAWIELGKIYLKRTMQRRAEGCFIEALKYDKESEEAREGLRASRALREPG